MQKDEEGGMEKRQIIFDAVAMLLLALKKKLVKGRGAGEGRIKTH